MAGSIVELLRNEIVSVNENGKDISGLLLMSQATDPFPLQLFGSPLGGIKSIFQQRDRPLIVLSFVSRI